MTNQNKGQSHIVTLSLDGGCINFLHRVVSNVFKPTEVVRFLWTGIGTGIGRIQFKIMNTLPFFLLLFLVSWDNIKKSEMCNRWRINPFRASRKVNIISSSDTCFTVA